MGFNKDAIPDELLDNFKNGLGAYFVGAGLSIKSGYPSWSDLLNELIELAKTKAWIDKGKIDEFEQLVDDSTKFLFLAEELKLELGSSFYDFMEKRFAINKHDPVDDHEYLVKTNTDLILTINYDNLIEKAYINEYSDIPRTFTYSDPKSAANNFWKGNFFILKAHGDAKTDVDGLILSQRDYRNVLYGARGYRSLIKSIFTTKSILFLGVSLTDPEFNQLMDYLHDSYHGGGPTHYILLERKKNLKVLERRYLEDFKIQSIPFNNDKGDYSEITEFLEILANEAPIKKP